MLDVSFAFDVTPKNLAAGTADQVSTNVFDAGSAKRLFEGFSEHPPKLGVNYKITAGTGALGFRARFVGADDAALTTNAEILADTGVQLRDKDDTALAIGDEIHKTLVIIGQRMPKRYYGVIYTQSTADQDGEVTAVISESVQSNMIGRKAAVP